MDSMLRTTGREGSLAYIIPPRALGWASALALGVSIGQAQYLSPGFEEDGGGEPAWVAEQELDRLFDSILSERREAAHARLEDGGSGPETHAFCPVIASPDAEIVFPRKRISSPLVARYMITPDRPTWRGVAPEGESASELFNAYISDAIVQSKCVYCHVDGGASGHTRLVFEPSAVTGHQEANRAAFQNFVENVGHGADLILNKIQGAEGHGGGVQVVPGSADFANMERFLRALGRAPSSGALSPESLFDGVTMASPARTLRRAALLFAGRLPTQAELNAASNGGVSGLRNAIRGLMTGPGFHDFLIRAANDRLLTDRERRQVIGNGEVRFVNLANKRWDLLAAAVAKGYDIPSRDPAYRFHEWAVQYGFARAPLELIAHVVENDLPYTEIVTADYVMANPMAAQAYGANAVFDNPEDPTEFKPSRITRYFRRDSSMVVEKNPQLGIRVVNPGNLLTRYPHAGVLNTTVFLRRYPTTPTNRNRARSRWTYYHFLGFDIEKSAARTLDPDVLADTKNPTMNNPACTVCHIPMDPVAGTYQNYGNFGLYRDKNSGRDALPALYRKPEDGTVSPYKQGDTWFRDMREPGFGHLNAPSADNSLEWLAARIAEDARFARAAVRFWWPAIMGVRLADPPADRSDADFETLRLTSGAQALEVESLAAGFRNGFRGGKPYNAKDLLAEIALSPWFRADSVTGDDPLRTAALREAGVARLLTPEELVWKTGAITDYVWGRRLQQPFGLDEPRSYLHDPQASGGYQLLYGGIDSDGITERTGDMTSLMAAVAQSHAVEVSCPIVRREFYYWPDSDRRLFDGITKFDTPLASEAAIRGKLVDLHQKLFGVTVATDSPDIDEAYSLFVDVWNRKRNSEGPNFRNSQFRCDYSGDHLYFKGLVDEPLTYSEYGNSQVQFGAVKDFDQGIEKPDPEHAVRTWVVLLSYLLTDYRYLYF